MSDLSSYTILVVDDNEELLSNLTETLSIFFENVLSAENGVEAMKIFKKEKVDLIITDYVMPEMNGYELCQKVREVDENIPLAVMSNFSDKDKLLKMIPMNLTEYVVKPIEYEELVLLLEKFHLKLTGEEKKNVITLNPKVKFDKDSKTLNIDGEEIKLSKSELSVLEILLAKRGSVVSTDEISISINEFDVKSEQAVKNIIHRLRKKMKVDGFDETISNIQGIGYTIKRT
jgi:two-component system response regulator VanR